MSNLLIIIPLSFVVCVLYGLAMSLAVASRRSEEKHERMLSEWANGSRPETPPPVERPRNFQSYGGRTSGSDSSNSS